MGQRSIDAEHRSTAGTEKHPREQAQASAATNAAGFLAAAKVASAKGYVKRICRQIPVAAKETASALPEIRNHYNVSLVVSGAGFDPCFPLAHVVGRTKIGVPITAAAL